jgi:hypothetical protein
MREPRPQHTVRAPIDMVPLFFPIVDGEKPIDRWNRTGYGAYGPMASGHAKKQELDARIQADNMDLLTVSATRRARQRIGPWCLTCSWPDISRSRWQVARRAPKKCVRRTVDGMTVWRITMRCLGRAQAGDSWDRDMSPRLLAGCGKVTRGVGRG